MTFWHDTQRDLLIYKGLPLPAVQQAIPETRLLNGSYFAVPRTLTSSQILRHFNYPVAPVITEATYDFPRPPNIRKPYESQVLAANFMALHPRCFNLSDMGVGKTLTALWAADYLMKQHPPGTFRCLIVAPLSILQRVWADAIFKTFLGKRTWEILHGTPAERMERLSRKPDFAITNFEGVGIGTKTRRGFSIEGFSAALRDDEAIQLIIVDEASAYKDSTTKRHRIARSVLGQRSYLWLITGTPTPNAPTDAFGLAKLVNNAFGKSRTGFKEETMHQVTQFKWVPRKDGYEKAASILSPSIRFDIRDVWDAPEMVIQQREVPLTDEQKGLFKQLKSELAVTMKSGKPITAANEAAARSKYLQISLGAVYDANHVAHKVDAGPRMAELEAVLEQAPGKWLCFVPFTSAVDTLHRTLKGRYNCAIVNGSVSQKERSDVFSAFQEGDLQGIIADPGTMSHGLDLWMARTVVWYGPVDKSELFAQANKRAHRPGQKYPVSVVQIVSNKLEIEIFRRLENNLSLQGSLLDLARDGAL
jgi:SNF2 family DNA or RNA helicase